MAIPSNVARIPDGRVRVIVTNKFDNYMPGDDPCFDELVAERLVTRNFARYAKPNEKRVETSAEVEPAKRVQCQVLRGFDRYMKGETIVITEDLHENALRRGFVGPGKPIDVPQVDAAAIAASNKAVQTQQAARK